MRDVVDARAWAASLVDAEPLDRDRLDQSCDAARLEAAVVEAWHRATAAHPSIAIPPCDWFAYVGARLRGCVPTDELARRNLADLYLACGCVREDPAALGVLERDVFPAVARKLASLRIAVDHRADLLQALRERMLVATHGACELASYDGRAPLTLWLRVAAAQMGRRQLVRVQRASALEDRRLHEVAPGAPDPALLYLKRHYGDRFRRAFAEAVDSLDARARNLLRHAILDELTIDQIAAIYHIHRATAARQLKHARDTLVAATRIRMRAVLGVGETELESILGGVMSLADVTLRQALARGRGHAVGIE